MGNLASQLRTYRNSLGSLDRKVFGGNFREPENLSDPFHLFIDVLQEALVNSVCASGYRQWDRVVNSVSSFKNFPRRAPAIKELPNLLS